MPDKLTIPVNPIAIINKETITPIKLNPAFFSYI